MLIAPAELAARLPDPTCVVFDCRHDLADHGKGLRAYREGHIPGAHFAAIETDLAGGKTGRNGRHPLPEPQALAEFLGRCGVTESSLVVAYDDAGGAYAARLWWLARWIGLARVALLDGGWGKWQAEGRAVTAEVPLARPAVLRARPVPGMIWEAGEVARRLADPKAAVVDARAGERFRGEVEPIDPVAGHIPGALNRFFKANLNPDLTWRPAAELRREFESLLAGRAPEDVCHQCGSGVTACVNLFAMEHAGMRGSRLYPGSWSEWIADPARPVARG
ncbi:MAG: sulfurtransferase [Opitutaceae bacterium]|nr:sulfurtransferase [Opitutaceae bacterium]